ncbi:hypothetical protein A8O14_07925 [Polynucleobacter wuianus]|uniref:DUF262 domain-containing protein n=1 Tax=Polynucleobacter wuianus TaxID=1743168 RepID=A0A191UG62_9BURK|nr:MULTISPECIES: DUF262 domain-containing protein [Polynucleobacter]ANJ00005.1 hypothetical protein A8O14_07925 [Polynucleobacter wuianus]MBU3552838.1 DUF262 domain-containing protein [Polynucleobacter sp. MWH-Post4-6-1]
MDTLVKTPQQIFMQPQRLLVPLFQRPYVWNQESQWMPLWQDLERIANRLLASSDQQQPHFLGAVVFQQIQNPPGNLQQRTVIDGQQRLTTLQILLDSLHAEINLVGESDASKRLELLIRNPKEYCDHHEDQFKVWPTNKDRQAFNEVMAMDMPATYQSLKNKGSKLVLAHQFFSEQFKRWLNEGGADEIPARVKAIERTTRELLQIVVIDLNASENAQEIFETLNARGSQLTAADLIKNFVFQRLLEQGADIESSYSNHWKQFETGFWEQEISVGRVKAPRSSIFLNHWLICQTTEEIVSREVFSRFKSFADYDIAPMTMPELLARIHGASIKYKDFIDRGDVLEGAIDRIGLFLYRTKAMEMEVVKPVLLAIFDRDQDQIDLNDINASLEIIESWLIRRMLVRGTTKAYNKIMTEMIKVIQKTPTGQLSSALRAFLSNQTSDSSYWPDDKEVKSELSNLMIYRKIGRGRLRMVLEAIEDYRRGWIGDQVSMSGVRVRRGTYAIEHLMPQSWERHWPLTDGYTEQNRNDRIHKLGNLTLLSSKLNSSVSNGSWGGEEGKRPSLLKRDVLFLNRSVTDDAGLVWDEGKIDARTEGLIDDILAIWPVPPGHQSSARTKKEVSTIRVTIQDLIAADLLHPGQVLYPSDSKSIDETAVILQDGSIGIGDNISDTPSGAGKFLRKRAINGWGFWLLNPLTKQSLRDVRTQYLDQLMVDGDDIESDDEDGV